jgi:hypothetical protein
MRLPRFPDAFSVIFAASFAFARIALAETLSVKNRTLDIQFSDSRAYNGEADYSLKAYDMLSGNPPVVGTLIPSTHVSAGSVGTTFTYNAGNHPDFVNAASIMADGAAQVGRSNFFLNTTSGGADAGDGGALKNYFGSDPQDPSKPDWKGYEITAFSFRLDSFNLAAGVPNDGLIPYHFTAAYTLTLEGEFVPEPASVLSVSILMTGLAVTRRRRTLSARLTAPSSAGTS